MTNLNATVNGTQTSSCYNVAAEKIGKTSAYCVLIVVSVVGNIFIGTIVYKTKTMRKTINFLIVNMAMSDLFFPLILFPRIVITLYVDSWLIGGPLGQALCKLVNFLADVSNAVSIQSMVLIAVDRFGAVVFPLRSPLFSSKQCLLSILATWIVALAINSPNLFAFKLVEYPEGLDCVWQWHETFGESSSVENYFVSMMVTFNFIPLVLIAMLYIIIYITLKSQKIPGEQSGKAGQQRLKQEGNVLKMAIAVVLGFAVCWIPYVIYWFLILKQTVDICSCRFQYFAFVAFFIAHASCVVNPCICYIFSENYRQGVKKLLRCF